MFVTGSAARPQRRRAALRAFAASALAVALLTGLPPASPVPAGAQSGYPFRDPRLPLRTRVDDLLHRLTLDEKISLLHQYQPAIPRLGIRPFKTGTEALHGVAWLGEATVFPQAIGLASAWDPSLMRRVGSAVGDETRGFQRERPAGWGLNVWAPVVNLLRDPRWGRNEEGYSEDPFLTGALSTAYGKGLQGDDPDHLKTAPTLKHYLANNNEVNRTTTSSDLRPRVLHEYDEGAFRPAVAADAATGVMSAYNLVNGRPNTVNPDLNDTVRRWTRRDLFHVTDAQAPGNLLPGVQNYYPTPPEADAAALKAGIDSFTNDNTDPGPTRAALRTALDRGLIRVADVDRAVRHTVSLRIRLGEFDPGGGRYGDIGPSVIDSPAHRALARETAAKAMVLLKNRNRTLPLDPAHTRRVAVVGPLSDTLYTDWYSGTLPYRVTPRKGIAERLAAAGSGTVTSREGVDRIALRNAETGAYVTAGGGAAGAPLKESSGPAGSAGEFDVYDWGGGVAALRAAANGRYVGLHEDGTFVNDQTEPNGWFVQQQFRLERQPDGTYLLRYAGYDTQESWFGDKEYLAAREDGTLALATREDATHYTREVRKDGAREAAEAARGADAAVVVVGSMPLINGKEDHDRTDMGLARQQEEMVRAVERANPRTVVVVENSYPTTLNWEQEHAPALLWTTHAGQETGHALADVLFGRVNPAGRLTQTWYRSQRDLPSILDYDIIRSDRTYQYFRGRPLYPFGHGLSYTSFRYGQARRVPGGVEVPVTNTGSRTGDEVVQLYTHQRTSRDKQPRQRLRAFRRVTLEPGRTTTVRLPLRTADLAHWDVTRRRWVVESGTYDLRVGASSGDIRTRTQWRVRGERIPSRDLSRRTRAADFDDYAGTRLADASKVRGDAVAAGPDGGRLVFRDADLGRGASRFTVRAAKETAGTGTVQVRLDSPTGPLAATARVPSTGSRYAYRTVTTALTAAAGRRDVHLILGKGVRVTTFALH
ncbi:glycoside hydrolase family 3 C-terminal domain-containing protein [Streptomyces cucumeris]|uniref:glycoside hydrolase family 3 C-terminal domain-containing protein n=1 Tax=Streptomyces cucumeris TaxID=2962890 RepID=UPI003D724F75